MAVRLGVSSPLVEHPRFPAIGYTTRIPLPDLKQHGKCMSCLLLPFLFFFFSFMPGISDKHFHSMHHEIMPKYATPGALVMDWFLDRITIKEMTRSTHTHHTYHLHTYTPPWNWNPILSRIGMVGGSPVSILHFSLDSNSNSCTVASIDLTWIKGQNLDRGDPVKVYAVHPEYGTSPILLWDRSFGLTRPSFSPPLVSSLSPWTG